MRILAAVALVFMALFTASTVAWCFDRTLFNGAIGYAAIFTGFVGIGIFVVLMLVKRAEARNAEPPATTKPETRPDGENDAENGMPHVEDDDPNP